ncbi:hypothetical protein OH492_14350 [Vibrio chagasii]|nr:hypothetical protein [Vibrio chagasii]
MRHLSNTRLIQVTCWNTVTELPMWLATFHFRLTASRPGKIQCKMPPRRQSTMIGTAFTRSENRLLRQSCRLLMMLKTRLPDRSYRVCRQTSLRILTRQRSYI